VQHEVSFIGMSLDYMFRIKLFIIGSMPVF